jgi:trigger factor
MAINVETLEKLERRITLTVPTAEITSEVQARLKKLSRTVKADGFRPGKVPFSVITQRYGWSVQNEVMNDKLGRAFASAADEAKLRVAGMPRISAREEPSGDQMAFDAVFEVYPEVRIGDLSSVEVERLSAEVNDAAIERTIEILRKQRRTFAQRPADEGAAETDRVTIDFEGKIDGEGFSGGKAEAFQFIVGEGQMLEQFDRAVRGMRVGDSKTFPLQFPADYHGKDVAGREADFLVTMTKIETQRLPEVDASFIGSLGIAEANTDALRADVTKNLEREVKFRLLNRNKAAALKALVSVSEFDLPKALIESEAERLAQAAIEDLKQRGVKDVSKIPLPVDAFRERAEERVRMGLAVAELVRTHNLQATPEQLQAHIEELSQSYERPNDVVRWYLGDRERMAEAESVVVERNVTQYILSQCKAIDKLIAFEELMNA